MKVIYFYGIQNNINKYLYYIVFVEILKSKLQVVEYYVFFNEFFSYLRLICQMLFQFFFDNVFLIIGIDYLKRYKE